MKRICLFVIVLSAMLHISAGDVASFTDLGFSADGRTYMFGQYGVTDKTLQGYAEIYIVDVASNSFVPDGVFRILPSAQTKGKDGKGLFNTLLAIAESKATEYKIDHSKEGRPLYVLTSGLFTEKRITFRDFEQDATYNVTLVPSVRGARETIASSFFLDVVRTAKNGEILRKNAGNPNYERKGVKDYQVRRVVVAPGDKAIICIVEKKEFNARGDSIRFMVETFPF